MKRGKAFFLVVAILLCGIATGAVLGRIYNPVFYGVRETVDPPPFGGNGTSDVSVEEIELTQGTGGDIEWILKAGSADYDQEKGLVIADRPQVTYYLGHDRKEVVVRAVHGEVSQKGEGLRLWEDVKGNYGDMGLKARTLNFKPDDNLLILSGNVTLQSPAVFVDAPRVIVDLKTREIMIENGIEALISPDVVSISE